MKEKCYDLIAKTSIELGLKTDGKTMASLAKILAEDLQQEKRFKNLTFDQISDAFRQGVRFGNFEPFLNIRTFYRWIIEHKKVINDATYQVTTLGKNPQEVPFYQSKKLLK
ncbi:MAG: hypothetical protein Unbinned3065contig1007_19 [Prokaryotic dsDNA virus sp.]|nr:MAG: hypothetical protein Unbinned3065contig1007_19 [Prokaryotic dsDNA virus sp.]|tara:strand:- start:11383 stop:11715 length:333 start_codon:yes stop_codon:yes gene_type:complete